MESNHTSESQNRSTAWRKTDLFNERYEVVLQINDNYKKNYDILRLFNQKTRNFKSLILLAFECARDGAYCPTSAEIRTVDSQSDSRNLL